MLPTMQKLTEQERSRLLLKEEQGHLVGTISAHQASSRSHVFSSITSSNTYIVFTRWMRIYPYHAPMFMYAVFLLAVASFVRNKCDTRQQMGEMLIKTTSILQKNKIEYWVDKGTLLGIIRDNDLIPWEYDVDLGVQESMCDKISELKPQFQMVGLIAYDRKDEIPHKVKLTYDTENHYFYYSDSHLHDPCIRVYDVHDLSTWVDIYWYKKISANDLKAMGGKEREAFLIPPNYVYNDDLMCNSEGIHELTPNMCCGGCVPFKTIFPLKNQEVYLSAGKAPFETQYFPNDSEEFLRLSYGKDSLSKREIKGWKGVACAYWTYPILYPFFLIVLISGPAALIVFIVKRRSRMYPRYAD